MRPGGESNIRSSVSLSLSLLQHASCSVPHAFFSGAAFCIRLWGDKTACLLVFSAPCRTFFSFSWSAFVVFFFAVIAVFMGCRTCPLFREAGDHRRVLWHRSHITAKPIDSSRRKPIDHLHVRPYGTPLNRERRPTESDFTPTKVHVSVATSTPFFAFVPQTSVHHLCTSFYNGADGTRGTGCPISLQKIKQRYGRVVST